MNGKATYLAFDCTSGDSSVTLRVGETYHQRTIPAGKQSALLVATIDALLQQSSTPYASISAIITTVGPGTFTGIRIALAAAHGFHLVHRTTLKTLTTMDAYAWQTAEACDVILNAGKGDIYHQSFDFSDQPVPISDIVLIKPQDFRAGKRKIVGNILLDHVPITVSPVQTQALCAVAERLKDTALSAAVPLYIRPPDAKLPELRQSAT